MKRIIFLFISIVCYTTSSNAQLSADFPDSNYYWNEFHSYIYKDINKIVSDEGMIFDKGDSLFQGKLFRKLFYKVLYRDGWHPNSFYKKDTVLIGLIRNEKMSKRVYYVNLFSQVKDSTEHLLFDFNLKVGDRYPRSFQNYNSASPESDSIVVKIDSINDPYGIKRAVYTLDTNNLGTSPIIQGIGSVRGLLINSLYNPFEHNTDFMSCINLGNGVYLSFQSSMFPAVDSSRCDSFQYTSAFRNKQKQINIYPNPFSSIFTISNIDDNTTFTLLNLLGQEQRIDCFFENEKWSFNTSDIPKGVYYLIIHSQSRIYTSKLFKYN